MSKARHCKKGGGRIGLVASGNPDVIKEAEDKEGSYESGEKEKKKGGRVKRARGGMAMHGHSPKHRMDRPGRKRGGAVGADRSPLSTAHKGSKDGHETPSDKDTYGGTPP
jgi:hypothetical protein